jgi:hypothetical protein
VLRTQALGVATLLSSGVVAVLDSVPAARALVVAAAVIESILACRAPMLTWRKRERALDVITEGRGDLAIDAVKRQRARLLEPCRRQRLAASLHAVRHEAERPIARSARTRPIFNVRVIRAVAPELTTVAELLRDESARLRGIAMSQRLILDGASLLYGTDVELLRQELRRIRYHLVDRGRS